MAELSILAPSHGVDVDTCLNVETGSGVIQTPDVSPENVSGSQVKIRSKLRILAVLTALFLTVFISALNTTIVSTALPTICSQLHTASGYAWIGGAYLLATGASGPIWAKLSDIWGRKSILLMAVAMYFTTSIVCALAQNMETLIIGRALQGTAGGGLTQLVNIVLSDLFSLRSRALYFGLLNVMWAIAGGIGPILGGTFAQYVSWRWIFWINLPVAGTTFLLLLIFLDVHNPRTRFAEGAKAIDWAGSLSILSLMVMLLLGLNFGGVTFPWDSPKVICLVVAGSLLSIVFVFSEAKLTRHPLMPLKLFANKSNIACFLVSFAHHFAVLANEYYLPLFFQSVNGASPVRSGVLLLPLIVTTAVGGIATGIITYKTGRYLELIWIGMVLFTIGEGLLIRLSAETSLATITVFEVIAGLGAGLVFEPPIIAIQAVTAQEDVASAIGTLGFIRSLSTALAAVIGGVIFQNGMDLQGPKLRTAGLPAGILRDLAGASAGANVEDVLSKLSDPVQKVIVEQAFAWSLRNLWILCTCMTFCGLLFSLFIKKKTLSNEHVETRTGLSKDGQ